MSEHASGTTRHDRQHVTPSATPLQAPEPDALPTWGRLLVGGALAMTLFNVLFPRAADPFDHREVLSMMAENPALRQVSFLGMTATLWILTAGLAAAGTALSAGGGERWAKLSRYGLLAGATLFTAAAALGMAATVAAEEWVAAGGGAGPEFAVAAALNAADDAVWFAFITVYWGALALLGLGMMRGTSRPPWQGASLLALGCANALGVGVPLLDGVQAPALLVAFGVIAQLSLLWMLLTGVLMLRQRAPA
jgi:hypothetical protein